MLKKVFSIVFFSYFTKNDRCGILASTGLFVFHLLPANYNF
jgi:hypothetical protein